MDIRIEVSCSSRDFCVGKRERSRSGEKERERVEEIEIVKIVREG